MAGIVKYSPSLRHCWRQQPTQEAPLVVQPRIADLIRVCHVKRKLNAARYMEHGSTLEYTQNIPFTPRGAQRRYFEFNSDQLVVPGDMISEEEECYWCGAIGIFQCGKCKIVGCVGLSNIPSTFCALCNRWGNSVDSWHDERGFCPR